MGSALYLAGPTCHAGVIVDDYRFLSFISSDFFRLEDCGGTQINAHGVSIAFVEIDCDCDHVLAPLRVGQGTCVIGSWFRE
jgi:hypothetical protein